MKKPALFTSFAASLVLLAASHGAMAASGDQFDLVCTGQEQKGTGTPPVAWKEHFRIDLRDKRWCRGDCKTSAEIAGITGDQITLSDSRAGIGGPPDVETVFSRADGKVREHVYAGWSGSTFGIAEGTCQRELFSGVAARKF